MVVLSAILACAVCQVVLRGEATPRPGAVTEVSRRGVTLDAPDSPTHPWDRVKLVLGDHADEAEQYRGIADRAWRARTRQERGDSESACALFESLIDEVRDAPGPTLGVIARGLLRCRLARGDIAGSVEAWALVRRCPEPAGAAGLIDEGAGLVPALAPLWAPDENPGAAARALEALAPMEPMAALYARAALAHASPGLQDIPDPPAQSEQGPGEALVRAMVLAQSGDAQARAGAREELLSVIQDQMGGWREAWARAGVGRSLLLEPDPLLRDEGIAHLLHLPARFAASRPRLARVALLLVAQEMGARADPKSEGALRDLADALPRHDPLNFPETEHE